MMRFSAYLQTIDGNRGYKGFIGNSEFFAGLVEQWIDTISHDEYVKYYPTFQKSWLLWIENLKKHSIGRLNTVQEVIKQIEYYDKQYEYFVKFIQYQLQVDSRKNPATLPFLRFSNDGGSRSGVKAKVFFVNADKKHEKCLGQEWMSGLGEAPDVKEKTAFRLRQHFSSLGFSKECKDNLDEHIAMDNQYHAEENLFISDYHQLIALLQKKAIPILTANERAEFDLQWLKHLQTFPRLEFYISSSPCQECRVLFRDLREKLNDMQLHIPIIVHYISPSLPSEVHGSQTLIVGFDGGFISTNLSLKTTYKHDVPRNSVDYIANVNKQDADELDKKAYRAVDAIANDNKNAGKIIHGLSDLINVPTKLSDLAWIFTFLNRFPTKVYNEYGDEINTLKLNIESSFNPKNPPKKLACKKQKLLQPQSINQDFDAKLNTWLQEDTNPIFLQLIFKYLLETLNKPEYKIKSVNIQVLLFSVIATVYCLTHKVMPSMMSNSR